MKPMASFRDEFIRTHDLYASGQEIEAVRNDDGFLVAQMVPPPAVTATPEGDMQFGTVGDILPQIPRVTAATVPGLAAGGIRGLAELGSLIGGSIEGAYDAYKANDGERLDAYLKQLSEHSKIYGGEKVKNLTNNVLDMLGIPEQDKQQFNLAADVGEVYGIGEGILEIPGATIKGLRKLDEAGQAAQSRLDAQSGTRLMSGIDPIQAKDELLAGAGKAARAVLPRVREQDELGFYSRAKDFVINQPQEKFTGQQLRGMMLNAGVKEDELKWTGLDQFLEENPNVTKQQVADYLDQNRVELTEVRLENYADDYMLPSESTVLNDMQQVDISDAELGYQLEVAMDDQDIRVLAAERYLNDNDLPYDYEDVANLYFEKKAVVEEKFPDIDYDEMIKSFDDTFEEVARESYYGSPDYRDYGRVSFPDGNSLDWEIVGNSDKGWTVYVNGDDQGHTLSVSEALVRIQSFLPQQFDFARHPEWTQMGGQNYRELLLTNTTNKGAAAEQTGQITNMLTPAQQAQLDELRKKARDGTITSGEMPTYHTLEDMEGKVKTSFSEQFHYPDREDIVAHIRVKDRRSNTGNVLYVEELQSDWAQRGRKYGVGDPNPAPEIKKVDYPETGETAYRVLDREYAALEDAQNAAKNIYDQNIEKRVPTGPFIDKTESWTELAMRRIIREAADGNYDYIAWTPGDVQVDRWNEKGLAKFYDKIIPKATNKVAKNLDKDAKTEVIDIDIGDKRQPTLALRITDKMRKAAKEGQPMFAVPAAVGAGAAVNRAQEQQGETNGNF